MALFPPLLSSRRMLPQAGSLVWPPLIVGHRGAAGEAPENTLAAFDLAARQGADGIEFDVHLSADGIPVVIHDARLERTTSGNGRVNEYKFSTLRRLDAGSWFNRHFPSRADERFCGQRILKLSELLGWVRKRRLRAYLEIKLGPRRYPGIEEKVLEDIARANVGDLTTIISFNFPTLQRVRHLDSRISLGMDFTRPLLALLRVGMLRGACVAPHWAFATKRFIRCAHQAKLQVIVWDLDQPSWMRRKTLDGVDGVITRFPAKMKMIRDRLEKEYEHEWMGDPFGRNGSEA
jgi:glycerophosphoryl diester phosphodiesterase